MRYCWLLILFLLASCHKYDPLVPMDMSRQRAGLAYRPDTLYPIWMYDNGHLRTVDTPLPAKIVAYATTLLGTPYLFGSTDPRRGFDCSGFITYVFHHFDISVPRSSVEFTNEGIAIPAAEAKTGDLILFTGTNSKRRVVGHMGIIVANDSSGISFIHASSGHEMAVIITPLAGGYIKRFVKVTRMVE